MADNELTTNDMVNLLRLLGNETEWTYQSNHDEANAIQSFVHAKAHKHKVSISENINLLSGVTLAEQQRGISTVSCVSPSESEMDDTAMRVQQDPVVKTKTFLHFDVTDLMTSDIIDFDNFSNSVPDEQPTSVVTPEKKTHVEAVTNTVMNVQDNISVFASQKKRQRIDTEINVETDQIMKAQPPKSKRAKKKSNNSESTGKPASKDTATGPLRALSAYNFFFRDERDRILNNKGYDWSKDKEDALLQGHWTRNRSEKRIHCKTHGKFSFTALSKEVSIRWKALPIQQRDFYRHVAQRDWQRYEKELADCSSSKD